MEDEFEEFNADRYVDLISDEALVTEFHNRAFKKFKETPIEEQLRNMSNAQLHDLLADLVGLSHLASTDEILNDLRKFM